MQAHPLILAAVAALAIAGPARADNAAVARTFEEAGLIGLWAWDCDQPVSNDNHYVRIGPDRDGVVTTEEVMSAGSSAYRVSSARKVPGGLAIQATWAGDGILHDIVYRIEGDRQAIWSSIKSTGRKLVIDGRLTANGAPVIWFERCRAGSVY